MASTGNLLARISSNANLIDTKLSSLSALVEKAKLTLDGQVLKEKSALEKENASLKQEISQLVSELNRIEGKKPGDVSGPVHVEKKLADKAPAPSVVAPAVAASTPAASEDKKKKQVKNEGKTEQGNKKDTNAKANDDDKPVDISRLDLRVGRIISAKRHPDADALYVEEVDVGEAKPRTVISGLVKFVSLEDMQNRMALLLCNLKPAKMRGILSEAMVMCASSPEKVEILVPPANAKISDRVDVAGYPGEADGQLNPKKKVWEQVAPDLTANSDGIACYKGVPLTVRGSGGEFKAPTLRNVQVK